MQEALTWIIEQNLHHDQNMSSIEINTESPTAFGYLRGSPVCADPTVLIAVDKVRNSLRAVRGKAAYSATQINRALESLQKARGVTVQSAPTAVVMPPPPASVPVKVPPKLSPPQAQQPKAVLPKMAAVTPKQPPQVQSTAMPIESVLQPLNYNKVPKDIDGAPVFKKPQPRQLPETFNGINPSKQRLQQRKELINQQKASVGAPVPPPELPAGHRPPLDKKPSLAEKKKALLTGDITKYKEQVKLPFFTFTVTSTKEAFDLFIEKWERQEMFSWSVSYQCKVQREAKDQVSPIAFVTSVLTRVKQSLEEDMYTFLPFEQNIAGLAICWSSSAVYFISLTTKNKHKQHEIEARWAAVRRVMANPNSKKVQFNMKPQMKMLMCHDVDGK